MRSPAAGAWSPEQRLTIAAIAGGLLVRILIAAFTPLLPDEAYYWEWSRHLAAGYFDHPPAIAWMIAGGTALLGNTPLGVRLANVAAGTAAVACIAAIARRLGGDRAAMRAALLLLCTPLAALGLAIATTDAPALLAVSAALLCIVIALEAPAASAQSTRWWLAAGIAFGVGLLSKLTVGIVGAAVGLALVLRPSLRARLRATGPWLAVLAAALVAAPVIWWNARHDWISLRFQLAHGLGAPARGSAVGRELSLVGSQLALLSPGIFLLAAACVWPARRRRAVTVRQQTTDATFVLAAVGTTVFAFFAWSALRRPVEPNWPAPAYVALLPLVAASSALTVRRWWRAAATIGALVTIVAVVQLLTPILPVPARRDPAARAHGWGTLARAADSARSAGTAPNGTTWLGADRYQDAAELAFLTPGHPTVFAFNVGGRPNQYDLWRSFPAAARVGDGLVVALDTGAAGAGIARTLSRRFAAAAPGAQVALTRGHDTITVRRLWRFTGWRGSWPAEGPGGR